LIDVLVLNQGAFVKAPAVAVTAPAVVVLVKRILGGGAESVLEKRLAKHILLAV
jgi:hypothetical protein